MSIEFGSVLMVVLLVLWRFCRCAHAWELVDKTKFPPKWDSMGDEDEYYISQVPHLLSRKIILVIRCTKCGAAQIFTESN